MNKDTLKRWADNPWQIAISFARKGWLNSLSDKLYLSVLYRAHFKKKINWENPKTFNEKLQWLKLHYRDPIFSAMVDKYAVKQHVVDKIGQEYVVPVVGGPWNHFEEIDFAKLPDRFVLKTTHDCGGVVICKDKETFDAEKARTFIDRHLKRNYYLHCREWPYKNIAPRIFAEQYVSDEENPVLPVYKIFCFNGCPKIIQAIRNDKQPNETIDYFDNQWNRLEMKQNFPNSETPLRRPENLDTMLQIAEKLSQGYPFIRIDLYEANGQTLFSEFTFYSDAGFAAFDPSKWDDVLGSWIQLPEMEK